MSWGCFETYQYKIFPIGVLGEDSIITIDFDIKRTHIRGYNNRNKIKIKPTEKGHFADMMFVLYSRISIYDKHQNRISSTIVDTVISIGRHYDIVLKEEHARVFESVLYKFSNIDLFKNTYISFCDFQRNCKQLVISHDTTLNENFVTHKSKKYIFNRLSDTIQNTFNSPYHSTNALYYRISSVRIFKSKNIELLVFHLGNGHELGFDDAENPWIHKEYEFKLTFEDIKNSTFEEPLLHHGYGLDAFVVKESP
jgi:hypothetical protein